MHSSKPFSTYHNSALSLPPFKVVTQPSFLARLHMMFCGSQKKKKKTGFARHTVCTPCWAPPKRSLSIGAHQRKWFAKCQGFPQSNLGPASRDTDVLTSRCIPGACIAFYAHACRSCHLGWFIRRQPQWHNQVFDATSGITSYLGS